MTTREAQAAGARFRAVREAAGFTAEAVGAELPRLSADAIRKFETRGDLPSVSNLVEAMRIIGADAGHILGVTAALPCETMDSRERALLWSYRMLTEEWQRVISRFVANKATQHCQQRSRA